MNRKLIRTKLEDFKGRPEGASKERAEGPRRPSGAGAPSPRESSGGPGGGPVPMGRKKVPPQETNAEIFYYKKQMDAHTLMVITLMDGEEVEGTIEWYDRGALKVNRRGAPNIMILKHNIKYMYKAEDRDGGGSGDQG